MHDVTSPAIGGSDSARRTTSDLFSAPGPAIAVIWLSTVVCAIFAPDMVTGSAHEHLPMAAITGWVWAMVATGYVMLGSRGGRATRALVLGAAVTWAIVALAVIFGPTMVTGSDPTTIPLTVLLAPIAGAVVTGFIALDNTAR